MVYHPKLDVSGVNISILIDTDENNDDCNNNEADDDDDDDDDDYN